MKIISGKYKGRKLDGFDIDGTRPTMDRVKESLFAIIQNYISESIVLDLFAGSGNLGIEALSEGAKYAYLVDKNIKCIKTIENNIKIIPVGGISAFTTLLSASGISGNTLFVGFLSNKSGKRKNQLKELYSNEKNIIVLYESVHRIKACIEDIVNIFGENTYIVIGRELTKKFEQIIRDKASNILAFFTNNSILDKGEFCIIIDNRKSKVCKANAENILCKESDYDN